MDKIDPQVQQNTLKIYLEISPSGHFAIDLLPSTFFFCSWHVFTCCRHEIALETFDYHFFLIFFSSFFYWILYYEIFFYIRKICNYFYYGVQEEPANNLQKDADKIEVNNIPKPKMQFKHKNACSYS